MNLKMNIFTPYTNQNQSPNLIVILEKREKKI
jgi:hypothetical protein